MENYEKHRKPFDTRKQMSFEHKLGIKLKNILFFGKIFK